MTMTDTMTILGVRNPDFANSSDGVEDEFQVNCSLSDSNEDSANESKKEQ